jgi:hypothetical protein
MSFRKHAPYQGCVDDRYPRQDVLVCLERNREREAVSKLPQVAEAPVLPGVCQRDWF